MSNTRFKDELIRIAKAMGLPDDTDLTTLGEQVETLVANYAYAQEERANAANAVAQANAVASQTAGELNSTTGAADAAKAVLAQVVTELEVRRDRAGSAQAFADMTAVADIARTGLS